MDHVTTRRRLPRAYRAVVAILRPLLMLLTRRDWRGLENLPDDEGFVVCPNHISYVDVLTFAHVLYDSGHPPFFLGKEGVFDVPVLGRVLRAAEQIPVHRETGRAAGAFSAAVDAVRTGRAVAIYPEGTLTRQPDQWPMRGKTGAARVALQTHCPVVPVAQWGPQEILGTYEKRVRLLPRRTIHVRVGPPVDLSDLYDRPPTKALLDEATERIMTAITQLLEDLRGETAPPVRFDPRAHGLPSTGNFRARRRGERR